MSLGETQAFLFVGYGLFSRAKVVGCMKTIWIHHSPSNHRSRHQEIAPTTPRELDVRAMVHFLLVWCDANWHHMFYDYLRNGEFPKANQYTVN